MASIGSHIPETELIVPQEIKDKVEARVAECIAIANKRYGKTFPMPKIEYTLRGQTSGVAWPHENRMNLNSVLLIENGDAYIARTPGHETAHIIDKAVHGFQVKGRKRVIHGAGWKKIMRLFGQDPSRCHSYDTTNSTVRKTNNRTSYIWTCGCGEETMKLGAKRHNNQRLRPTYWIRRHSPTRCGAYTHTHTIVGGVRKPVELINGLTMAASAPKPTPKKAPRTGTKAARAVELVRRYNFLDRDEVVGILQERLSMSRAGAQTYYYNAKRTLGAIA